jgi:DNA-binding response OmpR family regulator
MREVVPTLQTGAGCAGLPAASGCEVSSLAANRDAEIASVDPAMSDGSGRQTRAALRRVSNWLDVPIVVRTRHHPAMALNAARSAGASGCIGSPSVPSTLLQHVAGCTVQRTVADWESPVCGGLTPGPPIESSQRPGQRRPLAGPEEASRPAQGAAFDQPQAAPQVHRSLDPADQLCRDRSVVAHQGRRRLLLGEQHPAIQAALCAAHAAEGWVVDVTDDGGETLATSIAHRYDLLLANDGMPALGVIEIAHAVRVFEGPKRRLPVAEPVESGDRLLKRDLAEAGIDAA